MSRFTPLRTKTAATERMAVRSGQLGRDSSVDAAAIVAEVTHGPGAVRLLMHRRPDDSAQVQNEGQERHLSRLPARKTSLIRDISVTRSGFRDLVS